MFATTRRWLQRNRTPLAIGAGIVVGIGFAGQYVLSKIHETRQRMSDDRIAKDNLRRRFAQNQEDCTYTTLALLPTATENIIKAIPVEDILHELQQRKSDRTKSTASSEVAPSEAPSALNDEGNSLGSSSFIYASQINTPGQEEAAKSGLRAGKTKVQLWNDLKISSITRALTLVYTLSLLTIFTRIQLNLLGRRNYLSSVVSLAAPVSDPSRIHMENRDDDNPDQDYGSDFETNRKYLTFSWWLLHRGWRNIMEKVETAVKQSFESLTPRDSISFERLSELVLDVRKNMEGSTEEERKAPKWLSFVLPPTNEEEVVLRESGVSSEASSPSSPPIYNAYDISPTLRRLLDETSDLVESPIFSHVLTLLLDAAFSLLVDGRVAFQAYNFTADSPTNAPSGLSLPLDEPRVQEVSSDDPVITAETTNKQRSAKLATVLAVFTRQAHAIGTGGNLGAMAESDFPQIPGLPQAPSRDPNEYLAAIEHVPELKAFAAVVYSSNFEYETVDTTDDKGATIPAPEVFPATRSTQPEEALGEVPSDLESAWSKALAREDGRAV